MSLIYLYLKLLIHSVSLLLVLSSFCFHSACLYRWVCIRLGSCLPVSVSASSVLAVTPGKSLKRWLSSCIQLPPAPECYSRSHYPRKSIRKVFRKLFPFKIPWLTEFIEAAALFPVSRQCSSVLHQRRPFSLLHILQVHKQLVVLCLGYQKKKY